MTVTDSPFSDAIWTWFRKSRGCAVEKRHTVVGLQETKRHKGYRTMCRMFGRAEAGELQDDVAELDALLFCTGFRFCSCECSSLRSLAPSQS